MLPAGSADSSRYPHPTLNCGSTATINHTVHQPLIRTQQYQYKPDIIMYEGKAEQTVQMTNKWQASCLVQQIFFGKRSRFLQHI